MENDSAAARAALSGLQSDRAALAGRIAAPAWTHAAFGVVAAGFVAGPAVVSNVRAVLFPVLLCVAIALMWYQRTATGVQARSIGPRAWVVVGAALVVILAMFSVSMGLVASLSPWWVIAPAVVALGVAWWANVTFERLTQDNVRRG